MTELPGTQWRATPWTIEEALTAAPMPLDWREAGQVRHGFTHFELIIDVLAAHVQTIDAEGFAHALDALDDAALPSVMRKVCADGDKRAVSLGMVPLGRTPNSQGCTSRPRSRPPLRSPGCASRSRPSTNRLRPCTMATNGTTDVAADTACQISGIPTGQLGVDRRHASQGGDQERPEEHDRRGVAVAQDVHRGPDRERPQHRMARHPGHAARRLSAVFNRARSLSDCAR